MLVTTGYGMRRWFEVADAAGLGAELTAVLEEARIFARGPKAHGAVRAAGLVDAQTSVLDTTASMIDAMVDAGLTRSAGGHPAARVHRRRPTGPAAGDQQQRADRDPVPLDPTRRPGIGSRG